MALPVDSGEHWTAASPVTHTTTTAVAVPRVPSAEHLGGHRVSPPLLSAGPSPHSASASTTTTSTAASSPLAQSLPGSAGSEPSLHPPRHLTPSPTLLGAHQQQQHPRGLSEKKRSTIHLIGGLSLGASDDAAAAAEAAAAEHRWKAAKKSGADAILTTASDGRRHRRSNRMSVMRLPGASTPTLMRMASMRTSTATTAATTTTTTAASLTATRQPSRKGILGALKTLMRVYPLLPEHPTGVILEFGSVRKRATAPAKAFRTPEEFRAWAAQNCVASAAAAAAVPQSTPMRLEIYDEDAAAFTLFCDLQSIVEDAWFRISIVDRDEEKSAAQQAAAIQAALLASEDASSSAATVATGKFATISKSELRFTDGETPLMPIQQDVTDSFVISSTAASPVAFAVAALAEETPKWTLKFTPEEGHLRPGESATVTASLNAVCTTIISCDVAVTVECPGEGRQVTTLSLAAMTHPTSRIDYDEVKLQHPSVGSGASGTVFRGVYRGQEVACKVMLMQDETEAFEREVEMLEQLRSPYVVTFIGASHLQKKHCIVTEFLTLGSVLSAMQRRRFSWPLKIKCLLDCARGMCFLHSSGIMHRDLKPDNLMMATMNFNADVCCKITDFGTGRAIGAISLGVKTGGVGTPIYMAPEVLDSKPYSSSADVYSYALLIWFFCTEFQPYTKGDEFPTPWAISDFVLRGRRLPLPENAPPSLQSLISRCWDQVPSKRPNFSAIAEFLQTLLRGAVEEHQRERQARKAAAASASATTK